MGKGKGKQGKARVTSPPRAKILNTSLVLNICIVVGVFFCHSYLNEYQSGIIVC